MSRVLCAVINLAWLILVARIVLEWIQISDHDHPVARLRWVLRRITDPVLVPIRRVVPPLRTGGIALDLSPIVVMVLLWILMGIVCW